MNKHLQTIIGVAATALILTGCTPHAYVTTTGSYYSPAYGYHYGDGQPDGYYYNPNTQAYQYQQSTSVAIGHATLTFNDFYTQLSPHGTWVNIRPYGQVWIANVRNFQPYSSNGHWTYTTYGWTWVSNYSWGWGPFHYGRWGHDSRYGWYWVPGYEWGPAWVAWSSSADMYGWAPLMPGMHYDVRLTVNHFPSSYWTFMPGRYMGSTNIGGYYMNRSSNVTIIKNTTIINNYGTENNRRYSTGPSANDVQRYTGRTVEPLRVSSTSDSRSAGVSNNEYRAYRPAPGEGSSRSSTAPDNNTRVSTPSTGTRTEQPTTGTTTPQTNRQTQQPANRTSTPQANTQPVQSTDTREYRPTQEQPRVTNRATPQTTRQIQRAQSDNINTRQQQQQQQQVQPQRQQRQQPQQRQDQQQDQQQQRQQQRSSSLTPTRR